jgi:hypothetical protein
MWRKIAGCAIAPGPIRFRCRHDPEQAMPLIKPYPYPHRVAMADLPGMHKSLEGAFAERDYLYVVRYGQENPELHGCALILLGNQVGGKLVLERGDVKTARSFLYRAFGHWRDGDEAGAARWLAEARRAGGEEERVGRAEALFAQSRFHMVLHSDFASGPQLEPFRAMDGIEVTFGRMLPTQEMVPNLAFGQPLSDLVPPGKPVDLVLLNDLYLCPVGLDRLGAPVVAATNDQERYYEVIDEVKDEIDLLMIHTGWELLDLARPLGIPATTYPHWIANRVPKASGIHTAFAQARSRSWDLVVTGGLTADIYHDKRGRILRLAKMAPEINIMVSEHRLPADEYDQLLGDTRFTIGASRAINYTGSRFFESLSKGALHLVDEENATPYLFSRPFACFPVYRNAQAWQDVEAHLRNYDGLMDAFLPQIPDLEAEVLSMMPDDETQRARRFVRHLLFTTRVEMAPRPPRPPSSRTWVPAMEPYLFLGNPDGARAAIEQTPPPYWGRRAHLNIVLYEPDSAQNFFNTVLQGLQQFPRCAALNYARALMLKHSNYRAEADQAFAEIAEGLHHPRRAEAFPSLIDKINGPYWLADARIRDRMMGGDTDSHELALWRSYALNHRADMAITAALAAEGTQAAVQFARAQALMDRSLSLVPHNEAAQRLYLRALYGLWSSDVREFGAVFLENFHNAVQNDYLIFYDFAPLAVHVLVCQGKADEARAILEERAVYETRLKLWSNQYTLYPELVPVLDRYGIPHVRKA